ncbi:GAF domain-containing protein [Undibacterium macrobrachii]|uniref:histidine kinase n=1 Tax=Undibacterium macrobrachii TaxID=1119058 RepID=A0ABQ2X9E0_9BURK|nr:GAF domain-containing protein [Undibacterium macrobrachii]GGX05790.1 hypothetical protein GCM10011282_10230 [Undibacterium macrobrachii]
MESPKIPQNEESRLQALREYHILDTLPEERFDRLTRLAQQIFNVDIALVSLIDADRQWFKSKQGLDACETDREISFCGHAILERDIFHIPNALNDPRFADNPLVTGAPNIRFYAGAPLRPDGENSVGTLCIIDSNARMLSIKEQRILRDLADSVEREIAQLQQNYQHQALLALTQISSLLDPDYAQLLSKGLSIAQEFLGMSQALINRMRDQQLETLICTGTPCGKLQSHKSRSPVFDPSCQSLRPFYIENDQLSLIPDLKKSPYADIGNQSPLKIGSYIGVPIKFRGEAYGNLVFISQEARVPNYFSKVEIEFIQLFSEWVHSKIHEWELDQSLKLQQNLAKAISHAQERFIHGQDQSKGFQGLLHDILALGDCQFGFIGEILEDKSGDPFVKTFAIETIQSGATVDITAPNVDELGQKTERLNEDKFAQRIEQKIDIKPQNDIFTAAIRSNSVVIDNAVSDRKAFANFVPHDLEIHNFLAIPIHYNDQRIAMIGLANRPFGFQDSFIQFLDPILLTIGQLVQANRVQVQHTESERRLADIIKGTNIGTWEWNVQTGESSFNQRWAEIIGYSIEELSPTDISTWTRFAHPDDLKKSSELLQKHFDGELDYYEAINRMRHKDGHWVWILDRGCLVSRTADGKPLMMSGSHADISKQKEADAKLAKAYDLLEQSNTIARIGTWEIDLQSSTLQWSKVTKEIYEVPDDFVCTIHQTAQFYPNEKDQHTIQQLIQRAINQGISFDTELSILTYHKKERWVRIVGMSKFHDDVCERVYGTIQDISERKRVERMKDEFISTVSHELRTPLTSISGSLGLMVNGVMGAIPDKISSMLQIAYKNSQRLSFLINDLLDMEKILAGKLSFAMETQALAPLLQNAVESNLGAGIERMISIAIDNPHQEIRIHIDTQRLQQVLSNVISNAIKYSPNHGHIQITVSRQDKQVRITVRDQGPGIPLAFQTQIFKKFAQADSSDTRQRGGTGLGLAISKELIEAMHGKLSFSSVYGEGASFYIDLPIQET